MAFKCYFVIKSLKVSLSFFFLRGSCVQIAQLRAWQSPARLQQQVELRGECGTRAHEALVGCCWGALGAAAPLQDCWLRFGRDFLLAATLRAVVEHMHGLTFAALWMCLRSRAAVGTLGMGRNWNYQGITKANFFLHYHTCFLLDWHSC